MATYRSRKPDTAPAGVSLLRNALQWFIGPPAPAPRKRQPARLLSCEQLEDRALPSTLSGAGVLVLSPTADGALTLAGASQVNVSASVVVDSNSPRAVVGNGSTQVNAPMIDLTGGSSLVGNAALNGPVSTGVLPAPDPLVHLPAPDPASLPLRSSAALKYAAGSYVLYPGVYEGGITATSASLTLMPGIYYLAGGGLTARGSSSIVGNGVLIYNAPTGTNQGIDLTGARALDLTPPTTGTYRGLVFFQDRGSDAPFKLAGSSTIDVSGTIYLAGASAVLRGTSGVAQVGSQYIVRSLTLSGAGGLDVAYDPSSVAWGGTSGGGTGTTTGGPTGGGSSGTAGSPTGGTTSTTSGSPSGGTMGGTISGPVGGTLVGPVGSTSSATPGGTTGSIIRDITGGGTAGTASGGTMGGTIGVPASGALFGQVGNTSSASPGSTTGRIGGGGTTGTASGDTVGGTASGPEGGPTGMPWSGPAGRTVSLVPPGQAAPDPLAPNASETSDLDRPGAAWSLVQGIFASALNQSSGLFQAVLALGRPTRQLDPTVDWSELDTVGEQLDVVDRHRLVDVAFASLPLVGLAGIVVWELWSYYLVASAMASAPLWKGGVERFDLAGFLEDWEKESREGQEGETLQSLVG